jgi:hypothetical protein
VPDLPLIGLLKLLVKDPLLGLLGPCLVLVVHPAHPMCPRVDQRVVVQEREVVMRILPLILREKGRDEVRADVRPQVEGLA